MLTPPNCCIQVTFSINRATRCFETVIKDIHNAGSRFRCVLLADSQHQREKRAISIPRQSALKKMRFRASWKRGYVEQRIRFIPLLASYPNMVSLPTSHPRSGV